MKTIMDDQPKSLMSGSLLPELIKDDFVTIDQKYFCIHCKKPLYDPVQTECGHRLCRECVKDIIQNGQSTKCPAGEEDCVDLSQSQTFSDKSMLKELRNLKVYCRYKCDGCTEQVKWGELVAHMTLCSFGTVECPNKANGCTTRIPKAEIKQHINNYCDYAKESCSQCKTIIMRRDMKEHERDSCPETIIPCENKGCTERFARKQLTQHLQQLCSKRQMKCPFAEAGCQFRGTVENIEKHLQDTKFKDSHLDKAMKTIGLLSNKNSELENKIAALESRNAVLERQVNNLAEDITEVKTELAFVGNTAIIAKNKAFDYEKQVGHQNEAIVEMMDNKEDLTRKFDLLEKDFRDLKTSQSVRSQDSTAGTGQVSLLENQMTLCNVRIAEMDLRVQCLETASYDGILLWKICDYKRRKAEAKNGKTLSLYSQPFYTSRFGYKMCARIYLNGDGMGKNTHLSLFFVVMRGEYDPLLQWPFQQRVTFSLLDQTPGSNKTLTDSFRPDPASTSFKRPTTDMNIASGCPMFVAQTVVDNAPYYNTKDDCIFIKVVVDPANLNLP